MELDKRIGEFLREYSIEGEVLAGFSGGADSTALLLALKLAGAKVTAVHFNHGIRGKEADEDEQWSEAFCVNHAIPFKVFYLNVPENTRHGESCEEAARRLRLEHWQELALEKCVPVFLAHHADDALEELFLRLARGSNASAIVPMKPLRILGGVRIMRPMLNVRRSEIETWLISKGISDWRIDSTNSDVAYRRNAIRNQLLPLFRTIFGNDHGLLQALDSIRMDADFLDAASSVPEDISQWRRLHPAILPRAVRAWLEDKGLFLQLTRHFFIRLSEALKRFNGSEIEVPLNAESSVLVTSAGLVLAPQKHDGFEMTWNFRQNESIDTPAGRFFIAKVPRSSKASQESFAANKMPEKLVIRCWRQGDRMTPFGSNHSKKIQDVFSDAKVPRHLRNVIPILAAPYGEIIWIPNVRRAEFARIEDGEERITVCFAGNDME